ncbi:MAG: bifunctional 4-hydroxy-2-oxoglutarate aldolase/2-dehydro-3-deoxy-phosphogluconate aldolase [Caulobacterales bacterium]
MELDRILGLGPVICVVVIDDARDAVAIAEALVEEGLPAIEVTLRTPAATAAIAAMSNVQGAVVGAGTVLNADDVARSIDSGARFLVSPGLTDNVANAAAQRRAPLLAGVASASDIMRGLDLGLRQFKFFPAEASGGVNMLRAFHGPFPDVRFCPTGGVTALNAAHYLALPNVACVGGSWIVPRGALDVDAVRLAARAASALSRRGSESQPS